MSYSLSKKIFIIGVAKDFGATVSTEQAGAEESLDDIIGSCPLFTELTWYVLLDAFRKLEGCGRREKLPNSFGEGIDSKKELLSRLPISLQPGGPQVIAENEFDGWPAMATVTRGELANTPDEWPTIRAIIHVIKMADSLAHCAPEQRMKLRQSPFDIAAAYYRGCNQPVIKK